MIDIHEIKKAGAFKLQLYGFYLFNIKPQTEKIMISKFSVKRPYTVFVGVIAVIVIGIVALMRMTADLLPNMNLPYVMIITTDMGASPETVEKEVTAPIEASLATTSNLKNIQSMSYNSYSTVILEYEQSSNMDATMIEIQQSLDQIEGMFGDSVGTPIVMQLNPDMLPVMVAAANVSDMDSIELTDYIESDILPQLESIEGVASVTATDVSPIEIAPSFIFWTT